MVKDVVEDDVFDEVEDIETDDDNDSKLEPVTLEVTDIVEKGEAVTDEESLGVAEMEGD